MYIYIYIIVHTSTYYKLELYIYCNTLTQCERVCAIEISIDLYVEYTVLTSKYQKPCFRPIDLPKHYQNTFRR